MDLKAIRFIKGTKVSHDYEGKLVHTHSYRDLMEKEVPSIGIPAKQNGLIIIDIDVPGHQHKHDGREWWLNFIAENDIPETYTVKTGSGGYHFYYRLPAHINLDTFSPPAMLSLGVDIKYNGWVAAPPSEGYTIQSGNVSTIADCPQDLLDEISIHIKNPTAAKEFDENTEVSTAMVDLYKPYNADQIKDLRKRLEWFQSNGHISYSEWRDGLFSLKAGLDDGEILDEFVDMWTYNRSYMEGDEHKAREIVERAEKYGSVGPGTIFGIIKNAMVREGAPTIHSPFSTQEIFDKSGVELKVRNDGSLAVEPSESNVAAILGAMFSIEDLYHDIRQDLFIYKGNVHSDSDLVNLLCPMIQSTNHGLGLQKIKRSCIAGGLDVLLAVRKIDPHKVWLNKIVWDGRPRVNNFFSRYVGAVDSEYIRAVSKNFWLSLAARGVRPGCKFDTMVVLEGHEGIMKSSLVEAIGGDYTFCPTSDKALQDLDELRKMHQSVIVELPELLGLVNQDSNKVKGFLSKSHDHIRALFARKAMKHPRGFVFIGTTNDQKYLKASMGHRRFWPVSIPESVKSVNINGIKCDREQLFAEAVHRVNEGETFYEVPAADLKEQVSSRVVQEPLFNPITQILNAMLGDWTVDEVYQRLLLGEFIPRGLNSRISIRIENAMKQNSCEEFLDPCDGVRKWRKKIKIGNTMEMFI